MALEAQFERHIEDGHVKRCYMVLREREYGVSESRRATEWDIRGKRGEQRRKTMADEDDGRVESRKIGVMRRGKVWQAADELKGWVKEEGDEYAIHGGKVVTAKTVHQLGDGAVVRFASRLLGGGKGKQKKMAKRATEDEQGVTDASSSRQMLRRRLGL